MVLLRCKAQSAAPLCHTRLTCPPSDCQKAKLLAPRYLQCQ